MKLNVICAALAAGLMSGWAGPVERADVPSEPAWVLHLDVDGLKRTSIGKYILAQANKPEAENKLAAFEAMFSFDPRTALHGVTLFSSGSSPEDGVMVVYANFDAERLRGLARGAKQYESSKHRNHVIHSWIDEKKQKAAKPDTNPRTYAAILGKRVVFGQTEQAVTKALDVFDGKAANLAKSKGMPELGTGTGFIQGAARKLDLPQSDPNAAIFRMAKAIRFSVSEVGNDIVMKGSLDAGTEEVAGHMHSIAQGLVSLMKLNTGKPEGVKIAEALTLKQDGATLNVNLALPGSEVVGMLKADAARKAAKAGQ